MLKSFPYIGATLAISAALVAASPALAQARDAQIVPGVQLSEVDTAAAWKGGWGRAMGCKVALQPSDVVRRVIHLDARMSQNSPPAFLAQAELLAKEVDLRLRALLGGSESILPDADASIGWSSVPSELVVTARPDGRMTWRQFTAFGDSGATGLLSAALDSARGHGEALMIWPDGFVADSVDFRLSLLPAQFMEAPPIDSANRARVSFGAFALRMPIVVGALPIKGSGDIVYPHNNEFRHVTGQVIAEFIVDTTGRAKMSTFRDYWPSDKPRLDGPLGRYYDDFVNAIRDYTAKARFTPARIGSCTVPQWVQMPVNFQGPRYEGAYSKSH